jgi:hypothetical protein
MADPALLGLGEALGRFHLLFVVVGFQLSVVDGDLRCELRQADFQIAQIHRLRGHVLGFVRIVISLESRIVRGRGRRVFLRGQRQPSEFALLLDQRANLFHFVGRREARQGQRGVELLQFDIAGNQRFDLSRGASL